MSECVTSVQTNVPTFCTMGAVFLLYAFRYRKEFSELKFYKPYVPINFSSFLIFISKSRV
jgi:hypothetical protein